jgi:hypothetical protein
MNKMKAEAKKQVHLANIFDQYLTVVKNGICSPDPKDKCVPRSAFVGQYPAGSRHCRYGLVIENSLNKCYLERMGNTISIVLKFIMTIGKIMLI